MALATRCPHCNTTFRVASDQLKLRGGIVRCGACNEVFDGNAALIDLDAPSPPADETTPSDASASAAFDAEVAEIDAQQAAGAAPIYTLDFDTTFDPFGMLPTSAPPAETTVAQAGESRAQAAPESDTQADAAPAADADADAAEDDAFEADALPEPGIESNDGEPDFESEPESGPASEPEPEPEFEASASEPSESESESEPSGFESEPEAEAQEAPQPEGEPEPEPAAGAAPESAPEADPGPESDAGPEPGIAHEAEPVDEPASAAEARHVPPFELIIDFDLNLDPTVHHEPSADTAPEPALPAQPVAPDYEPPAALPLRASAASEPFEPAAAPVRPAPKPQAEPEPDPDEPEFVRRGRRLERASRTRRMMFVAGSALLALVLVAQGVTIFRNVLAAKYPQWKPALTVACAMLGCRIELPAQVETLSLETGELQTVGADTFALTTLLRNQGDLVQTWPRIELALTDANDKPLLRRVFSPVEYLPPGTSPSRGFAAHSEQPVKLYFALNQIKASGYHIAVFYP